MKCCEDELDRMACYYRSAVIHGETLGTLSADQCMEVYRTLRHRHNVLRDRRKAMDEKTNG